MGLDGLDGNLRINKAGHLEIAGCDAVELARIYGTPLYVMDEDNIRERAGRFRDGLLKAYPDSQVIYAGKAFSNLAMCRIVAEEGLGLDVASGGELYTALMADFPPERIYFHGNNKTPEELEMGLRAKIGRFMVDNFHELEMLEELARKMRTKAHIMLRTTPGVEAHTHEYIRTGQLDSKFGFGIPSGQAIKALERAFSKGHIVVHGVHCHIGSQIFELESYRVACEIMMDFLKEVRDKTGRILEELNLGGGLGIRYTENDPRPSLDEYIAIITGTIKAKANQHGLPLPKVLVEPGRYIVGEAGITLYTIGSVKEVPGARKYVAVDGGYTDNPRVALYRARYRAMVANKATEEPVEVVSIAGRSCESGDMLIWDIKLPRVEPGDILAVFSTGAYHYAMSSNYNRFPRPAVVFVSKGRADIAVERETYEDLISKDRLPAWLASKATAKVAL